MPVFPSFRWLTVALATLGALVPVSLLSGQTSFTTRHSRVGGNFLWGLASGPVGLVAVGDGGTILHSPDGTAWTRRVSGVSDWLVAVTYGAGRYLAVGDHGRVLSSADGASWTVVPQSATTARLNNVTYAGGLFVAVGESGAIITSPDARIWTARVSGTSAWLRGLTHISPGITYGSASEGHLASLNSGFWACGQDGTLLRSLDGAKWASVGQIGTPPRDLEALAAYKNPVVGGTRSFAAVGADGTFVWEQAQVYLEKFPRPDGQRAYIVNYFINPFSKIAPDVRFRGLAIAANALFAMGEGGAILSSPGYGIPWTRLASGTTANLVFGLFAGNSLYVVGENETVLQSTPLFYSRLTNISTRGQVGTGAAALIAGMVVQGSSPKRMLVRAAGPSLATFGVAGALASPVLSVLDASGRTVATNADWNAAPNSVALASTAAQVGAFPFTAARRDAAVLLTLEPGTYTLRVAGAGDSTGVALVESYDADGSAGDNSRAINISTRGYVGPDGNALIAGFTVGGASMRRVLVRAVGPTLRAFGLSDALSSPRIALFRASFVAPMVTATGPWSADAQGDEVRSAAFFAGAFALAEDSADAAFITDLPPGSYTAVVTGVNDSAGVALVEIYDLP